MKYSSIRILIVAIALQGCAGTVNPQGKGTRALIEGSKQLSIASATCPRGIGVVRLYKDTLDGNKTKFNSKLALTSKNIEGNFNVYNLLDENHKDLLKPGEREKAKADVDNKNNSILVRLSDKKIERVSAKVGDGTSMLRNSDGGINANINDEISIRFNPAKKYYENWGTVDNGALSIVDMGEINKAQLNSVHVKLGASYTEFPVPETIDAAELNLDQVLSTEAGKDLPLKLNPKTYDTQSGMIYVQLTNGKKGKDSATYNYIVDDAVDKTDFPVPTKGVKAGEYILNVFRSEIFPVDADEKAEGAQNFCMEVGTGIMGRASISEPKPAKK
jgi:predicted DNA binding CopG/RHH family protein